MKQLSVFSKKQLLLAILLVSISAVAHAETYTSTAVSGTAVDGSWYNGNPVSKSVVEGMDTYTFQDNNTYIKSASVNTLINNSTAAVKVVADGNIGINFQGFGILGSSVFIGDNISFKDNINNAAITTTVGSLTVGNNVTISNISKSDTWDSRANAYGAIIIGDSSSMLNGTSVFGANFKASNNSVTNSSDTTRNTSATGGAAIAIDYGKMDLIFGDNAVFTNNSVQGKWYTFGGAISGISNESGITSNNKVTFNGGAIFTANQAISADNMARGGAIAFSAGTRTEYPAKESDIIFNSAGKAVYFISNVAETKSTTAQAQGGAVGLGEGNLYIEAGNIVIKGNVAKGGTALGGAIFTSKTTNTNFFMQDKYGKLTLVGNAEISGNEAIGTGDTASSYGGALFAAGDIVLRPNGVSNTMLFIDNSAKYGNDIYLNGANTKLVFDYANGGTVKIYDGFSVRTPDSGFVQTGNGLTQLWNNNDSKGFSNIDSGTLALEAAITQANSIDGTETTYAAGKLSGKKITLGTINSSAVLNIYDGAALTSGLTNAGDYFNISNGNIINIYGSGAINLDTTITDEFHHFGSDREINIGNSNTINLAARTAEQIAANTYNTRGTDSTKFTALHLASVGSGNTFTLNSNIAINQADKLVVSSTAAGQNYIKIGYDPTIFTGGNANESTKTLVVEGIATPTVNRSANANLQGTFVGAASDIGVYSWTPTIKQEGDNWYIVGTGSKPTEPSTTVKTSKTMTHALMSTFRLINNDLLKRMGELRFNPNNAGVWLRTYTGESELKGGGEQRYTVIQGGVDKVRQEQKGKRFTGIALEHIHSANSFDNGSGTTKIYDIGIYQSWLANSGHYYDIVGKVYKTSNSMNIVDSNGVPAQGDYKGWAYGLSMEYGYRKELGKGYFAIPQIEFTYRHVGGLDYTTSNGIEIQQQAYDSLVGRAGITIGRKYNNESQVYLTANIMREFIANTKMRATDTLGGSFREALSGKETWYNLAIGATIKNGKKNDWYMELERDFGSSCNNKWQVLLGTRWNW